MRELENVFLVNGEKVRYGFQPIQKICDCGGSCPPDICFERRRTRSDEYEGHRGDEGDY